MCRYIYIHAHIYKLPFNLSHTPEPRLVTHPTHLGASPGSAVVLDALWSTVGEAAWAPAALGVR